MPKTQKATEKSIRKSQNDRHITVIEITSSTRDQLLNYAQKSIRSNTPITICTPNPEIVLASSKNAKLRDAIRGCDIAIPDGVGIVMADKFLRLRAHRFILLRVPVCMIQGIAVGLSLIVARKWLFSDLQPIKGRVFFEDLVELASKKKLKVMLVGGRSNVARLACNILSQKYPGIEAKGIQGSEYDVNANPVSPNYTQIHKKTLREISRFKPDMLFVALGAPRQEIWMSKYFGKTRAGLAMGVGGTFDFVAGNAKVPPKIFEKLSLEWLWRFMREPKRFKRITNAVISFPWMVFKYKINN